MIEIQDLEFGYAGGGFRLKIPNLRIDRKQRFVLVGPSGSGKTTLISLIAGIITPQSGRVRVSDFDISAASDDQRRAFRIKNIGFVFQEFELLNYLSVRDNILLPFHVSTALDLSRAAATRAEELAHALRIGDKLRRSPGQLSQGERQRVAICRALVTRPQLLVADEPTGNLDADTAQVILNLLLEAAAGHDATLLVVSHNPTLFDSFDRTINVCDYGAGGES